jgi:hypothetical protein
MYVRVRVCSGNHVILRPAVRVANMFETTDKSQILEIYTNGTLHGIRLVRAVIINLNFPHSLYSLINLN